MSSFRFSPIPPSRFYSSPSTSRQTPPPQSGLSEKPTVQDTPFALKTNSFIPFSSGHRVTDVLQRKMEESFQGRFVGPISVGQFSKQFMPAAPTTCPKANFSKVIKQVGSIETSMYNPFVEACDNLAPSLEFVNTSAQPDMDCILSGNGLKPDVCAYSKGSVCKSITDFSNVEIFIEFKVNETQDAFVDPRGDRKEHNFEKDTELGKDTRGQLIAYASAQMEMQFRAFCFSVLVCGRTARLIRWDHAGAVVTNGFDYGESAHLLAQFFWRYNHMDAASRGYDCSVDDADYYDTHEARIKLCTGPSTRIFNVDIPDDSLIFDSNPARAKHRVLETSSYLAAAPTYTGRCLGGRFTRTFNVYDKMMGRVLLLKDAWRIDVEEFEKEGYVYAALEAAKVPYVAKCIRAGDVMEHKTRTQNLVPKFACKIKDNVILPHRHYRLLLDTIGTPLWQFDSSFELVQAVWDAIEAHKVAYEVASYLHRDISAGNIMIHNGRGLLIDWDLAKKREKLGENPRRLHATGTWQFISASLLMDPRKKHELADDLESFLHVVIWVALCFSLHNLSEHRLLTLLQTVYDEGTVEDSGLTVGGTNKRNLLMTNTIATDVKFRHRPKLDFLLAVVVQNIAARYEADPVDNGDDSPSFKEALLARRQRRMRNLQTSDWILKQGRDALLVRDDWPRNDKAVKQLKDLGKPQRDKRKSDRQSAFDTVRKKIVSTVDEDGEETGTDICMSGTDSDNEDTSD